MSLRSLGGSSWLLGRRQAVRGGHRLKAGPLGTEVQAGKGAWGAVSPRTSTPLCPPLSQGSRWLRCGKRDVFSVHTGTLHSIMGRQPGSQLPPLT